MIALTIIVIICIAIGYAIGRRRSSLSENTGEGLVRQKLKKKFKAPNYHLLNNITLPTNKGSTQIDHILVSTKGIFVIETKHYSGWIFANAESPKWTQVLFRFKSTFQNPLHQNYGHVKALQQLLDFQDKEDIHSVVIFTGSAVFKTAVPEDVFTIKEFIQHIRSLPDEKLSINRMQFCVGRIECQRYALSKQTDIEHASQLIKRFGD